MQYQQHPLTVVTHVLLAHCRRRNCNMLTEASVQATAWHVCITCTESRAVLSCAPLAAAGLGESVTHTQEALHFLCLLPLAL